MNSVKRKGERIMVNSFVGQEKETTIPNTRNIITSCNFLSREFGRAGIIELERQSRIIGVANLCRPFLNDSLAQFLHDEKQDGAGEADDCDHAPVTRVEILYLVKFPEPVQEKEINFDGGEKNVARENANPVEQINPEIGRAFV